MQCAIADDLDTPLKVVWRQYITIYIPHRRECSSTFDRPTCERERTFYAGTDQQGPHVVTLQTSRVPAQNLCCSTFGVLKRTELTVLLRDYMYTDFHRNK